MSRAVLPGEHHTLEEVADSLRVKPRKLRRVIRSLPDFNFMKIGRTMLFDAADVAALV